MYVAEGTQHIVKVRDKHRNPQKPTERQRNSDHPYIYSHSAKPREMPNLTVSMGTICRIRPNSNTQDGVPTTPGFVGGLLIQVTRPVFELIKAEPKFFLSLYTSIQMGLNRVSWVYIPEYRCSSREPSPS